MAKWKLTDNSTGSPVEYTFAINPNAFTPPGRSANLKVELTTAPNGQSIVFQGFDKNQKLSFSGLVTSQTDYNNLITWSSKRYVLTLTDDQGQTWDVLLTKWDWVRKKSALNQWRFDYSAEALVM